MKCTGIVATLFAAAGIATVTAAPTPVAGTDADQALPPFIYIVADYKDVPGLESRDLANKAVKVRVTEDVARHLNTRTPENGVDNIILAAFYTSAVVADEAAAAKE